MKNNTLKVLALLSAIILCSLSSFAAKKYRKMIKEPDMYVKNTIMVSLDSMLLTNNETKAFFTFNAYPETKMTMAKESYIEVKGEKYKVLSTENIELGTYIKMPDTKTGKPGSINFTMTFPAIPKKTKEIDLYELDRKGKRSPNFFQFCGIRLDGKKIKSKMPKIKYGKADTLPKIEIKNDTGIITGEIINYLPTTLNRIKFYDHNQNINIKIKKDGTFSFKKNLLFPQYISFSVFSNYITANIAPGKTVNVYIYPHEASKGTYEKNARCTYFTGYMADVLNEINSWKYNEESMYSFSKEIQNKDSTIPQLYNDYINFYRETLKKINKTNLSPAVKKIYKYNLQLDQLYYLRSISYFISKTYAKNHNINRKSPEFYAIYDSINKSSEMKTIIDSIPLLFPDIYDNDVLYAKKEYRFFDIFYTNTKGKNYIEAYKKTHPDNVLEEYFFTKEMENLITDLNPINTYQMLDIEKKGNKEIESYLKAKNEELLQKLAEYKKHCHYTIEDISKAKNEDVFAALCNKHKGKVILMDFWATYCGPCKQANRQMIPLKKELKDKVVFMYITSEGHSPENTWKNMILAIDGEHYRITDEQWDYVFNGFLKGTGVPTYVIIDKNGNIFDKFTGFSGSREMKYKLMKALKK